MLLLIPTKLINEKHKKNLHSWEVFLFNVEKLTQSWKRILYHNTIIKTNKSAPEIKVIRLDVLWEYISKKPLIPNTTKVLKIKKIKISKNKFNPKNVVCATPIVPSLKTILVKLITRTKEATSAKSNHLI